MCRAAQMQGRAGVSEEHRVIIGQVAEERGEVLGTDRLDAGTLGGVMLQCLMEALGLPDILAQERFAGFRPDHRQQRAQRGPHVVGHAQLQRCPPAQVGGVAVDLDGLHVLARQELREREVGAERSANQPETQAWLCSHRARARFGVATGLGSRSREFS